MSMRQFAIFILAFALRLGTATATNWVACASEGGTCSLPPNGKFLMRYGSPQNGYFFAGVKAQSSFPCSNYAGDPSHGAAKSCAYTSELDVLPESWTTCAAEGGTCNAGAAPTWVRYGSAPRWYMAVQSGSFTCDTAHFAGIDPANGLVKECQVGAPAVPLSSSAWTTCATEGQACAPSTNGQPVAVMLRYGSGSSWTYRYANLSSIICSNSRFNIDPNPGHAKTCQYIKMPVAATTVGAWQEKVSCQGCYGSTFSITWGTSYSSSTTNTEEWSTTVTSSVEAGISIAGAAVSTAASYTYAHTQQFETALESSYGQTSTVACGPTNSSHEIHLYQFVTETEAACMTSNTCSGSTYTLNTLCVVDPGPGYEGPQCLPGYCADAACTTCTGS